MRINILKNHGGAFWTGRPQSDEHGRFNFNVEHAAELPSAKAALAVASELANTENVTLCVVADYGTPDENLLALVRPLTPLQQKLSELVEDIAERTGNGMQDAWQAVAADLLTVATNLNVNTPVAIRKFVASALVGDEPTLAPSPTDTYTLTVEFAGVTMAPERLEKHLRENVCGDCEHIHCSTPGKLAFEFTEHLADHREDALAACPDDLASGIRAVFTNKLLRAGTPGEFAITYGPVFL